MGQFMTNTILPKYADSMGASTFMVGLVGSSFAVTTLLMRPVSGAAIDSFNRKNLLILTEIFIALANISYRISDNVTLIIISRAIHGIGAGAFTPLALTIVSGCLPEEKMASGIGVFALGQAFSMALGPNIGLFLVGIFDYHFVFIGSACLAVLSIVLVLLLPNAKAREKKHFAIRADNVFDRGSLGATLVMMYIGFTHTCVNTYIVLYGLNRGVERVGLYFTAYAASLLISRPLSGSIADRFGYKTSMIPAFICSVASYIFIGLSDSLYLFIIAGIFSAFGQGSIQPSIISLSMRLAPPERSGVVVNTLYAGLDFGMLIAGPVCGFICTLIANASGNLLTGYSGMFFVLIIPAVIGLVCFLYLDKKNSILRTK